MLLKFRRDMSPHLKCKLKNKKKKKVNDEGRKKIEGEEKYYLKETWD